MYYGYREFYISRDNPHYTTTNLISHPDRLRCSYSLLSSGHRGFILCG